MSQFQPPFQQESQQPHTGYPQWQQPPQQSYPPPQPQYRPPVNRRFHVPLWLTVVLVLIGVGVIVLLADQSHFGTSSTSPNAGLPPQQYKAATTDTTVADLDKDGNADSGKDVHFTATILNFVKDSSGNTAGANVSDPGTFTSIIQVEFPAGTDVSQLNTQDQIEVWGTDNGTSTGTNAFGATVHEVAISALYMTDQTTGYSE